MKGELSLDQIAEARGINGAEKAHIHWPAQMAYAVVRSDLICGFPTVNTAGSAHDG